MVLFGAGAAGRYALRFLRERGIKPQCFVDNDPKKQGSLIEGAPVFAPDVAFGRYAHQQWVACGISRPAATEIRAQMREMGVDSKPLWECVPVCHGLPPDDIRDTLFPALGDIDSGLEFNDQVIFRRKPCYDDQMNPSPISELYFPPFIKHRDDEHYVDVGAADGDTVQAFRAHWPKWGTITAFEPDARNWRKLLSVADDPEILAVPFAASDVTGDIGFEEHGDWSSHVSADAEKTESTRLDDWKFRFPPTYIKMDIEGHELQALWGARRTLKEHSPVLAVCAYHTSDHLWEIPLLIHAINPTYKLFFRRYAEGAFETVWYAVPPERIQ